MKHVDINVRVCAPAGDYQMPPSGKVVFTQCGAVTGGGMPREVEAEIANQGCGAAIVYDGGANGLPDAPALSLCIPCMMKLASEASANGDVIGKPLFAEGYEDHEKAAVEAALQRLVDIGQGRMDPAKRAKEAAGKAIAADSLEAALDVILEYQPPVPDDDELGHLKMMSGAVMMAGLIRTGLRWAEDRGEIDAVMAQKVHDVMTVVRERVKKHLGLV